MKGNVMRSLLGKTLVGLFCGIIAVNAFAAKPAKELLTPENMKRWKKFIPGNYRGGIKFDLEKRLMHFNTFDSKGHVEFYDKESNYSDFRIDCVVSFSKMHNKYSGFNLFLRAGDGNRYWVYWRPKNRGLHPIKIRSGSKPILEYDKGKKMEIRPASIKLNKDYTFSVEIRGRVLQAFIDGKKIFEFVDPMQKMYTTGMIGFAGGTSDLTVKSIKLTDLTESDKLPVKSYKYINPPEKGDKSEKNLTDGKIGGKKEQALWWLATKGDPVIVFDLGKVYFINGVKLKALAPPNANISAYRILGSSDGKKFKALAGEVNDSEDPRVQEQVLQCKLSSLARYVKVMLFRQAGDATIKLDEVEIMGREARPEDKVAIAKTGKYYRGAKIPAVSKRGKSDKNYYYLQGGGLRIAISHKTGNIGPVYNIKQKQRCIMISYDKYYVETRKSAVEFSEKDNTVIKSANIKGSLVLTCRNRNIKNVDIIQTYKTTADGFSKMTEMVNKGNKKDLFATIKTGAILDQKFRKNGWYLGADRGLGGRLKASQVTMSMTATCHSPKNTKVVLFMNYEKKYGIGQYRYAMNGEYCEPVTSRYFEKNNHAPLYTANGWKMGLLTLKLAPNIPRSVEVRWNLFAEDEFNFLKQYTSIPEVSKLFNIARPDWLLRLKTIVVSDAGAKPLGQGANKDYYLHVVKRSADLYDDGFIYTLLCGDDVWGDWFHGEPYSLGWCGDKKDNKYLSGLIKEMHQKLPSVKTGLYTWAWTGWAHSKSFKKHPEWYISRNKNGYLKKAYQNGPMNYVRMMSAPGSKEDFLTSAKTVLDYYDTDFFYIDGGGGGSNLINWQTLKLDYDVDWQSFHWGLNKAARKKSPECVFFTNSRSEAFVDIGYYEGINNRLSASAWRESADAMLALKMRSSLFPKMTFLPIYWRTNTIPFFSNYCIGLGLVPDNVYSSRELRNIPYVGAAYETRMFTFVPAGLIPSWRKDIETELEAYTLTHAPAAIFSIINHSKIPIPQSISADASRLGIKTNKPIFSWLVRMIHPDKNNSGMSERTAKKVYQQSRWGVNLAMKPEFIGIVQADKGRIGLKKKFDLNLLNLAVFSNCPAVIYSANGARKHLWQPNSRGITVSGGIDLVKRLISLKTEKNITAKVKNAELLVYAPNNWSNFKVSGATIKQQLFVGKQRFLLLAVNGFGNISISAKTTKSFKLTKQAKLALKQVNAPGKMSLNLPSGDKYVTVYHKGAPVFFGNTDQLDLPQELASGKYRVEAIVGNTMYTGEFAVKSAWKYPYTNFKSKRGPGQFKISKVNRVVKGLKILQSAETSHDGYSHPLFAETNVDKLQFSAGTPDFATSKRGYAAAGLEIDKVKVLQLQTSNTFFRHWSNYDRETWRPGSSYAYAGLIVDYHTPKGYTKRVAVSMGLLQPGTTAPQPYYGKKKKADLVVRLKDYIHTSNKANFSLDLQRWAPEGWDGRVWISSAVNGGIFPGRRIYVTITGTADSPPKDFPMDQGELVTSKITQPEITVPAISAPIKIDGKLDEKVWNKAAKTDHFKLTTSMREPAQKTLMYLCRDKKNLYIGVKCSELERKHFMSDNEKIWAHDAVDITFVPFPRAKRFHKFVINHENEIYQENRPINEKQIKWKIKSATSKGKKAWYFEAAVPLKYLKLKNGEMIFNMLRYRPETTGVKAFTWSLIPLEDYMNPKWFGIIKLK
jgi:Carbohydrate family 9 binding domain-like/F5/8 type C domain